MDASSSNTGDKKLIHSEESHSAKERVDLIQLRKDHPELKDRWQLSSKIWQLDVRELTAQDSTNLTLAILEKVPVDVTLVQVGERVPRFLLPFLRKKGLLYKVIQTRNEVRVEIRAEKKSAVEKENFIWKT